MRSLLEDSYLGEKNRVCSCWWWCRCFSYRIVNTLVKVSQCHGMLLFLSPPCPLLEGTVNLMILHEMQDYYVAVVRCCTVQLLVGFFLFFMYSINEDTTRERYYCMMMSINLRRRVS